MSMPADRQAIIISPEHLAGSLLNLTPGMSLASAKEVTARRNRFPPADARWVTGRAAWRGRPGCRGRR
jgi:hypothetical protein